MNEYFLVIAIIILALFDVKGILIDLFNYDSGKLMILISLLLAGGFYYFYYKTEKLTSEDKKAERKVRVIESRIEENESKIVSLEQGHDEMLRAIELRPLARPAEGRAPERPNSFVSGSSAPSSEPRVVANAPNVNHGPR